MSLEIREEDIGGLAEHGSIPLAFLVDRVLDVDGGIGGLLLSERRIAFPYQKDYDRLPNNAPSDWPRRFDVSSWGLLVARSDSRRVGGAVLTHDTDGVDRLEGRRDVAALWDLRVHPERRRQGLGSALFAAAEKWCAARGCRWMKIETQNVNVPACRFYAARGCVLGAVDRFAYPDLPEETMLVWYKQIP